MTLCVGHTGVKLCTRLCRTFESTRIECMNVAGKSPAAKSKTFIWRKKKHGEKTHYRITTISVRKMRTLFFFPLQQLNMFQNETMKQTIH